MLNNRDISTVENILGPGFFEELKKAEVSDIVKLNTRTALAPEEIRIALQIVPRTVLSYLFSSLKYLNHNEGTQLNLPFAENAMAYITKRGPDNYDGEIIHNSKRVVEFKNRSLPAIGLMILTSFELYDLTMLDEIKNPEQASYGPAEEEAWEIDQEEKLQRMIDERLFTQKMVEEVIERKLSEKEAINKIIKERLDSHIREIVSKKKDSDIELKEESMDKKSKLREFLDSREKRRAEYALENTHNEIECPDCGSTLHRSEDKAIVLCICYGQFHNKKINIDKKEDGKISLKFPKSFDIENIEMLLDVLRNKG